MKEREQYAQEQVKEEVLKAFSAGFTATVSETAEDYYEQEVSPKYK